MANQPDPENVAVNIRLNRFIRAKLAKYAAASATTPSALIRAWIDEHVSHVKLTAEEYDKVLEEIRKARKH